MKVKIATECRPGYNSVRRGMCAHLTSLAFGSGCEKSLGKDACSEDNRPLRQLRSLSAHLMAMLIGPSHTNPAHDLGTCRRDLENIYQGRLLTGD